MTKRSISLVLPSLLLVSLFSFSFLSAPEKNPPQKKTREADLAFQYQEWLHMVAYIILPQEKDVFMKLSNDFERDTFIEAFWKQRDPTPGTPENEYKKEVEKRFLYVNKEFHKDTPRAGWMTDRGRVYMILGEPKSRDSFSAPEVQPCELWNYYGDASKGQPNYFGLIFFRRGGSGEYKLYSPATDGVEALAVYMPGATVNTGNGQEELDAWMQDKQKVYSYLQDHVPDLAPYSLSITPNEQNFEMDVSMSSEVRIAEILDTPHRGVNPSYATHFMNYKGLVTTEYLTNFVDSTGEVEVALDPVNGIPMLHYTISPMHISVDYYEAQDKYYCNFTADVSIKKGETFVYQSSKDFSYYFPPADSAAVSATGIAIQDALPVIPGTYRFTALIRNSVGKEFSVFEKDITVEGGKTPRLSGLMFGYKAERADATTLGAFKLLDQKASVDAKNTFSNSDTVTILCNVENLNLKLWQTGELRVAIKGAKPSAPPAKNLTVPLNRQPFRGILPLSLPVSAADLPADYYDVTVSLVDQENVIASQSRMFMVSPAAHIARPVILTKVLPRSRLHLQYLALAGEAEKAGDAAGAEAYFQKAISLVSDDPETYDFYCGFLMRARQYEKALKLIDKIKTDSALQFDYCIIKGKALRELGRYDEAIPLLEQGNGLYNSDTRLLNALGYCYYKTGQPTQALEVLNASLKLNADQPDIKKLVDEISKSKK